MTDDLPRSTVGVMATVIHDGQRGQWFVLLCDHCGASLEADSLEKREVLREATGWSASDLPPDLCPDCAKLPGHTSRRAATPGAGVGPGPG